MTLCWPRSHPGAYRRGGGSGTRPPAWGGSGHCLLFGTAVVRAPRFGLAPRQIEFCWGDAWLCWLFIVLLRVGYASLGVDFHLLYVTWHSFIEVASPGNLCHSINLGNCPAVQLTSHSLKKAKCILATFKGSLGWVHRWGLDCNISVSRALKGVSSTGYHLGSRALIQKCHW